MQVVLRGNIRTPSAARQPRHQWGAERKPLLATGSLRGHAFNSKWAELCVGIYRGLCWSCSPLRLANCVCLALEVCQHVGVVALKLANARESPPAITLGIRRISQLTGRAHANRDLRDHLTCSRSYYHTRCTISSHLRCLPQGQVR